LIDLSHFGKTTGHETTQPIDCDCLPCDGAGGRFAYDAYREHERQERLEALPTGANCSLCPAGKADHLERMKMYNAQRAASEAEANTGAD